MKPNNTQFSGFVFNGCFPDWYLFAICLARFCGEDFSVNDSGITGLKVNYIFISPICA